MHSFCLLTLMELILIPNCGLLHLHSNDMNSLNSSFLEKKIVAISIIVVIKNQLTNSVIR